MIEEGVLKDRDRLARILSKAVTIANGYHSPRVEDDLRVLKKLNALFLGRSAYRWITKSDEAVHFEKARLWASRVHSELSEEVICQAAVFEVIYPEVDDIEIPSWVFEELGETVEHRNFSYNKMLGRPLIPGQGVGVSPFAGGGIPDITQKEAFRWFYYRAGSYLRAGYEALHLGQIHLVGGADMGYVVVEKLIHKIRKAAEKHARRGFVILDAHSHGICRNGKLLFDFTSRPLSSRGIPHSPEDIALVNRGKALGGVHPGGWYCEESPVLVEVDNWLGYSMLPDDPNWNDPHRRAAAGKWGWDDVSWFANQSRDRRHNFLKYAHRWCQIQGREWYFQPVITRSLGQAAIEHPDGFRIPRYRANNAGAACPEGFSDEDAILSIWEEPAFGSKEPINIESIGQGELVVAEPVTVVGSLQEWLGGIAGDASCPWSRLLPQSDYIYERVFSIPVPGEYGFFITAGGTMTDPTKQGGVAGGKEFRLSIHEAGQVIRIRFDYWNRRITVVDVISGEQLSIT